MAKAGVLFCIVCAVAAFGGWVLGGGVVGDGAGSREIAFPINRDRLSRRASRNDEDKKASDGAGDVIRAAQREIGVREVGQNGGKRVLEYLAYAGVKVPAPYCAGFVSWCFGQAGYKEPRTAWSPALFPKTRVVRAPDARSGQVPAKGQLGIALPRSSREGPGSLEARNDGIGLVFGIYFPELKRIGHCGFVESIRGEWVQTIEGNTSPDGGREGIGVFRRLRHKRTICKYADWL